MKKSVIASVMALGMASGLAQAADTPDNEIQFKGNVSTVTCDLAPSVNGSLNPDGVGVIQLGDVKVGGTGKVVSFAFKPTNAQGNQTACDNIANGTTKNPNGAAYQSVDLTWKGVKFGNAGLGASDGSAATDSHVEIKPVNSTGQNTSFIKASGEVNSFPVSVLGTGNDGLKYEAVLKGGQVAGEFAASANFNMSYN